MDPDIAKKIKNAWVAGAISGGLTLVVVLIAIFSGKDIAGIDAWSLIDVVFILGFSYGVYRKSRTCAILLFVIFLLSKVITWVDSGRPSGLPLALVFLWYYAQGIVGTFAYHKALREGY